MGYEKTVVSKSPVLFIHQTLSCKKSAGDEDREIILTLTCIHDKWAQINLTYNQTDSQ